jgi:DNA-nicking Smr family endonuclease
MSRSGRKSERGRRTIAPDEAELWKHATRALEPVKAKPRVATALEPPAASSQRALGDAPPAADPDAKPTHKRAAPASRGEPEPAPIARFERRKARQIAAGRVEIGARVDLHGLRQADARSRLRAFLFDAHARGHRTVLVITGKGGEEAFGPLDSLTGERRRGVLRRNVPGWLEEPDLRAIVLSYTQAGIRHGGAGALYVQLRKGSRSI